MKVYKCYLDDHVGKIEDDTFIMPWMARWAAMAYNRFQQGHDGWTLYTRPTGRMCRSKVKHFGRRCFIGSQLSGERKDIMEVKWREGLWLGT